MSRREELSDGIQRAMQPMADMQQAYPERRPDIPARRHVRPYTDTGLDVTSELTEAAWRGMAPEIKAIGTAYQLIVGDYTLYGIEHGFVKNYEQVAELTGLKPETIEVFASVCRSIPRLIRINSLDFGHYRLIAPLPDEDKERWIQHVAAHALSVRDLRKAIKEIYNPPAPLVGGKRATGKQARQSLLKIDHLRQKSPETMTNKEYRDFLGAMELTQRYLDDCKNWLEQGRGDDE